MPSPVDDIVDLQIVVTDKAPSLPNFGTPLLLGYHTAWLSDLVREYESQDDMLDDGFTVNDALYKAATTLKSQVPSPKTFKIGRRVTALTQVVVIAPTITTPGYVYSGTIGGETFTRTNGGAETTTTIATALTALITAFAAVNATSSGANITVTTATAGVTTDYDLGKGLTMIDSTVDTTTDDELAAIRAEDDDWYGFGIVDSSSKATALLVGAFIEAHPTMCILQTCDDGVIDPASTTDQAYALKALTYNRTGEIYHRKLGGSEWLAIGWHATGLAADPGSYTMAFKSVAGVSVDKLTASAKTSLKAKNASRYIEQGGLNITFDGKAASGRYFDITRFVDWQQAIIQLRVFALLVNNPKIPYTESGLAAIGMAISGGLVEGRVAGGIADDTPIVVNVPKLSDTTASDRANRIARNFTFTARLSGALHGVQIRGTLSV